MTLPQQCEAASKAPSFRFVEFNPRRVARGAEGARVEVSWPDGSVELLWMSKRDVAKNVMAHGRDPELMKAHAAYGGKHV
jgi:hypothetical protein